MGRSETLAALMKQQCLMPQERKQSEFSMDEKVWTKVGLGSLEMGAVNAAGSDVAHLRPGV